MEQVARLTVVEIMWSVAMIDSLRELAAKNLSGSQIAVLLERQYGRRLTRNSVIGKANRIGLRLTGINYGYTGRPFGPHDWQPDEDQKIRDYVESGATSAWVLARSLSVAVSTVRRRALVLGVELKEHSKPGRPANGERRVKRPFVRATGQKGLPGLRDIPLELSPNEVSLYEATKYQCRWPVRRDVHEQFFCGGNAVEGYSYCAEHCGRAYRAS